MKKLNGFLVPVLLALLTASLTVIIWLGTNHLAHMQKEDEIATERIDNLEIQLYVITQLQTTTLSGLGYSPETIETLKARAEREALRLKERREK